MSLSENAHRLLALVRAGDLSAVNPAIDALMESGVSGTAARDQVAKAALATDPGMRCLSLSSRITRPRNRHFNMNRTYEHEIVLFEAVETLNSPVLIWRRVRCVSVWQSSHMGTEPESESRRLSAALGVPFRPGVKAGDVCP